MDKKQIKIYKMNDIDWWVDYSEWEAKENYINWVCESVGVLRDEVDAHARELSNDELHHLKYYDGYDDQKRTFYEQLQIMINRKEKFPCFFASTEW